MLTRVALYTALAGMICLLPVSAHAARLDTKVHGSYRLLYWNQSDLPLGVRNVGDPVEMLGARNFVEHRLRVGALLSYGSLEFDFEVDALNGLVNVPAEGILTGIEGPLAGAPRPEPADPLRNRAYGLSLNSFAVRRAMLTWKSNIGNFAIGPTTFEWGQGMLSNDGSGRRPKDRGGRELMDDGFGDARYGDRAIRLMYATKPLYYLSGGAIEEDVTSVIGFDVVLQDETATLMRPSHEANRVNDGAGFLDRVLRDRSYQAVLALKHARGGYSSGVFATRRWLSFPTKPLQDPIVTAAFPTDLQAWAVDVAVDYEKKLSEKTSVYAAVEGALVTGSTNYVRNATCPGTDDDSRCGIFQQGFVARTGVNVGGLTFDLLGGYASGDGNPFDDSVTNFRMDRDFKVGLILFDQVVAWQSAAQVRRAADPTITNEPNAGLELLSTGGAITNAAFVNPTVRYQATKHLGIMGGVLWGMSPQRYTDAFWVTRTSEKTNLFGMPAGRNYGYEFDVGASYTRELRDGVDLNFGVQAGYFLPGDAFAVDTAGNTMAPVYLVKTRAAVVF